MSPTSLSASVDEEAEDMTGEMAPGSGCGNGIPPACEGGLKKLNGIPADGGSPI